MDEWQRWQKRTHTCLVQGVAEWVQSTFPSQTRTNFHSWPLHARVHPSKGAHLSLVDVLRHHPAAQQHAAALILAHRVERRPAQPLLTHANARVGER